MSRIFVFRFRAEIHIMMHVVNDAKKSSFIVLSQLFKTKNNCRIMGDYWGSNSEIPFYIKVFFVSVNGR